jgi:hypothetical protein
MIRYNQITRKIERQATKFIISRHKEFAQLSIHDKEGLLIETRNKLEDFSLFVNLFFIISSSLFLLNLNSNNKCNF